jgi:hypothetical protein
MPEVSSNFSQFDAQAAGAALGSQPHTTRDVAHGDGEALNVGETTLEVYRDAGVARVTTPDARIELFRVPYYSVNRERVIFEQGEEHDRTRLQVRADGKVAFHPVLRALETPQTDESTGHGRQDSPTPQVASETPTASTDSPEGEKSGEVQLVQMQGRLGRDPWFGTRDDRPAAGFPLAVHQEGSSKAIWHDIVTFDDGAGQLHEAFERRQITKGKLVGVTGQPVVVEEPRTSGGIKRTAEFHAMTVTRVQSRPGR